MNVLLFDNVLKNPDEYIKDILEYGFQDFHDSEKTFHGMQPRGEDEFLEFVLNLFPNYKMNWNFVRQSPLGQPEPNYIHKDDMMGEITAVLYLSKEHPKEDGTTLYDDDENELVKMYSKFNRMVAFPSSCPHSRNIFENFGNGDDSRLVQVIFLSQIK